MNISLKKYAPIIMVCSLWLSMGNITAVSNLKPPTAQPTDFGVKTQGQALDSQTESIDPLLLVPVSIIALAIGVYAIHWIIDRATEGSDQDALERACCENNVAKVRRIINRAQEGSLNLDIELRKAASHNRVDLMKLLLEKGADINCCGDNGRTPLHATCLHGKKDAAFLLIGQEANLEVKERRREETPLFLAYKMLGGLERDNYNNRANDYLDIIKYLIEKNANVNAQESWYKESALHIACKEGKVEHVQYFLEHGANIELQNIYGDTPLHIACEKGRIQIVEQLLEKGADINALNNVQKKPIHSACATGQIKVAKLLEKHGANLQETCYERNPENPVEILQAYNKNDESKKQKVKEEDIAFLKEQQTKQKQILDLISSQQNNKQNIKELIKDHKATTYARQQALPLLVAAHKNNNKVVTEQELKELCNKTPFNHAFFSDERFADARDFAQSKNIKDIRGKTVGQAKLVFAK